MSYWRFFAMIGTSTLVMFGLMYLNTYQRDHVFYSETRAYMALLMGAVMAIIMLGFMVSMYRNRAADLAIFGGAVVVFAASLWLVRSQVTVQDLSYLRAMIPHHSIAIMTSSRAEITDPRVRQLADDIIYAQDKEIAEMRYLVADIAANGTGSPPPGKEPAAVMSASAALSTVALGRIDPEFLSEDEIARVYPDGAGCRFSYTDDSPPVLVTRAGSESAEALIKISGDLVRLPVTGREDEVIAFADAPLAVEIRMSDDATGLHDLTIAAADDYRAGFRGFYRCAP